MDTLNKIFSYYDNAIAGLPVMYQCLISLGILLILFWNVYLLVRSGKWIFIVLLIVMLPGTWPAAKQIGIMLWTLVKGLYLRII